MRAQRRQVSGRLHPRPLSGSVRRLRKPARNCRRPSRPCQVGRAGPVMCWLGTYRQGRDLKPASNLSASQATWIMRLPWAHAARQNRARTAQDNGCHWYHWMSRDPNCISGAAAPLRNLCNQRLSRVTARSAEAQHRALARGIARPQFMARYPGNLLGSSRLPCVSV